MVNTKWFLPQNRELVYIIGHLAASGRDFKPIFPIGENDFLLGNSQKSKQGQPQTQYSTTLKANGNINADDTFIQVPKIAGCLTGGGHSGGLHPTKIGITLSQPISSNTTFFSKGCYLLKAKNKQLKM